MPAKLDRKDDELAISLSGLDKFAFQDALMKVRSIPGRRWHPESKTWRIPDTPDNLMRVVYSVQPELTAEIKAIVAQAQAAVADDLVNKLPDDAALAVPWEDRLYRFQRAAVEFATENRKALICDDMGLGKTVEAISTIYESYMRDRETAIGWRHRVPTLIIAANSTLGKWQTEYAKWCEGFLPQADAASRPLPPVILDGKTPKKRAQQFQHAMDTSQIVVVNWEKLQRPEVPNLIKAVNWYAVVADEVHRAKNRKSAQSQALRAIDAPVKLGLTGTPIMTAPDDLWSVLNWLDPKTYSSYWRFFHDYTDAYQGFKGYVVIGVKNPDALRFELRDKLVRRTKPQVGIDLPPNTRSHVTVPMRPKQAKLYDRASKDFFLQVEKAANENPLDFDALEKAILAGDTESVNLMIPHGGARFAKMRQIAVSPALVGEADESGLLDAAVEIVKDNPGKPFVAWGFHQGTVELMAHRLRKLKPQVIAEPYHGGIDRKVRDDLVKRFQEDGTIQVLCCTIRSGNEGIDLYRADTALWLERDSVPSKNQQGEARINRIGQVHPTTQILLASDGTVQAGRIEELNRVREMIEGSVLGKAAA